MIDGGNKATVVKAFTATYNRAQTYSRYKTAVTLKQVQVALSRLRLHHPPDLKRHLSVTRCCHRLGTHLDLPVIVSPQLRLTIGGTLTGLPTLGLDTSVTVINAAQHGHSLFPRDTPQAITGGPSGHRSRHIPKGSSGCKDCCRSSNHSRHRSPVLSSPSDSSSTDSDSSSTSSSWSSSSESSGSRCRSLSHRRCHHTRRQHRSHRHHTSTGHTSLVDANTIRWMYQCQVR